MINNGRNWEQNATNHGTTSEICNRWFCDIKKQIRNRIYLLIQKNIWTEKMLENVITLRK